MSQILWGFERKSWPTIRVSGPDRIDFLQRLTTQNFKTMQVGECSPGACLNGNGTVVALFMAWIEKESVSLLVEPQSQSVLLQHLDKLHFGEDLQISSELENWLEVRGTDSQEWIKQHSSLTKLPAEPWGAPGYLLKDSETPTNLRLLNEAEYYAERARHLFPRDQVDIGENNIILEAGLLDYVHRNKGCYPGQEVVERIFTYGNVAKRLVLLEGHALELDRGSELFMNEKKAGHVTSRHAGSESSYLYLATVFRLQAVAGNIFSLGAGQPAQLKVLKVAGDNPSEP